MTCLFEVGHALVGCQRTFVRETRIRLAALLAFVALAAVGTLAAQSSSATLAGTVLDATGAVLPKADLTLVNIDTGAKRQGAADVSGAFTFTTLPPGRYTLRVSLPGFTPSELRAIVLNLDDRISLRVELSVASRGEGVTVVADAARVNTSPAVSTVVDREFVANLPLSGRSFQATIQLAPGVVQAPGEGLFSVNGQRSNSNYFTIDGVSANARTLANQPNTITGQLPMLTVLGTTNAMVSVDALQELRVQTSTYAPEFGRTPGGQISMVTRSGTNVFHGSAFDYFRDESMDATDWFVNNRGLAKPELSQHDFGGVFGGPVLKNRTFFFFSYEGLRLEQPRVSVASVPSLGARRGASDAMRPYLDAFPAPNGRDLGNGFAELILRSSDPSRFDVTSVRADHEVNGSMRIFARISHGPSRSSIRSAGGVLTSGESNTSITSGSTWMISKRLVHDLRVSYTTNRGTAISGLDDFGGAVPPPAGLVFGAGHTQEDMRFGFALVGCCTWIWGSSPGFEQRQVNIVDSVSFTTARHTPKFGIDFRRSSPILSAGGQLISTVNATLSSLSGGQASTLAAARYNPSPRTALSDNISFYAQDDWKLSSRLTTTYGVRWEFVPPMRMTEGPRPVTLEHIDDPYGGQVRIARDKPLWKNRYSNIAPRVGGSYVVSDKPGAQLVLRGGFGVFHDLGLGAVGTQFTGWPFIRSDIYTQGVPLPLPETLLAPGNFAEAEITGISVLDPNIRLPLTHQWNVTMERAFGFHQTLTVAYVGAAGRKLLKNDSYRIALLDRPSARIPVSVSRNRGYSDYRSLQVQFQRRLHRGLQASAAYTLSRSQDTVSGDLLTTVPAERLPPELDYGASDFDARHVFNAAATVQLPELFPGGGLWNALASGWSFDAILRARSAYPLTISTTTPFPPDNQSVRPNIVGGQPFWIDDPDVPGGRRLNRSAFSVPPPETQGDLRRGAVRGFSARQLDAALRREFRPRNTNVRLQFRFELFNVLNTPLFVNPETNLENVNFGVVGRLLNTSGGTNAVYQYGGPRSSQVAVKIMF